MKLITLDCNIYGVAFFGDGATIKKVPLINCLVSGAHLPAACLEIVNCSAHLVEGRKKLQSTLLSSFILTLKNLRLTIWVVLI